MGIFKPQEIGIDDESEHCPSSPPQELVTKHFLIYHCTSFLIENSLLAIMYTLLVEQSLGTMSKMRKQMTEGRGKNRADSHKAEK